MSPAYQPMTFEELSEIYRVEKNGGSLSPVRQDLFKAIADLMNKLSEDYARELKKDPESIMCEGANEHRKKADRIVRDLIEFRNRKICLMAVRSASSSGISLEAMVPEEREFYAQLQDLMRRQFGLVDGLRGRKPYRETRLDEPAPEPAPMPEPEAVMTKHTEPSEVPAPKPEAVPKAMPEEQPEEDPEESFDDSSDMPAEFPDDSDAVFMGDMTQKPVPEAPAAPAGDEYAPVILRILEDLPPFVGPDRDYKLSKEDIVVMPKVMADALSRMQKAVVVRPTPRYRHFRFLISHWNSMQSIRLRSMPVMSETVCLAMSGSLLFLLRCARKRVAPGFRLSLSTLPQSTLDRWPNSPSILLLRGGG